MALGLLVLGLLGLLLLELVLFVLDVLLLLDGLLVLVVVSVLSVVEIVLLDGTSVLAVSRLILEAGNGIGIVEVRFGGVGEVCEGPICANLEPNSVKNRVMEGCKAYKYN